MYYNIIVKFPYYYLHLVGVGISAKPLLDHDPRCERCCPYDQAPYYKNVEGVQVKFRAIFISVLIGG